MTVHRSYCRLQYCDLPQAWRGRAAWTVLDTSFGDSRSFLETWQAWRDDPQRPRMLHYVGIAPSLDALLHAQDSESADADKNDRFALARTLRNACNSLSPGFHRLHFDRQQVSLTLCVGTLPTMLAEMHFLADSLFLGPVVDPVQPQLQQHAWDKWLLKSLTRLCRRGTRFHATWSGADTLANFREAGFEVVPADVKDDSKSSVPAAEFTGTFNPRWNLVRTRRAESAPAPEPTRCAVIGAGLAGACVAHALALRGWQVTVFDQHATPAAGASGLPAGLVVPHVSADDSPRSRLSRSGTRLMLHHASQLLVHGQDWELSGVLERRPVARQARAGLASNIKASVEAPDSTHWHPQAGWIKPARLIQQLLEQPGIAFSGQSSVQRLERINHVWSLRDAQGEELGRAELVVFANALACKGLADALPPDAELAPRVATTLSALQAVHGTVSYGPHPVDTAPSAADAFAPFPINGHGSLVPHVPTVHGATWFAGATFETHAACLADVDAQNTANLERVKTLAPQSAAVIAPLFDRKLVSHWIGTRCVSHDRLPLVGPLQLSTPRTLWISAAMGARGLSFSALCAELLVARLCAEPLPVEFSLSGSLDVQRGRR